MKEQLIKQFIKKTIVKVFIFSVVMVIISSIVYSMNPVLTNELALSQMQNSNEMYVLMNTYYKSRPILSFTYCIIIILFMRNIICDVHRFVKNINEENKEN